MVLATTDGGTEIGEVEYPDGDWNTLIGIVVNKSLVVNRSLSVSQ
jgi:hypothetical protein